MNVFCIHYSKICYVHTAYELYPVVIYSYLDFTGIKSSERGESRVNYLFLFFLDQSEKWTRT